MPEYSKAQLPPPGSVIAASRPWSSCEYAAAPTTGIVAPLVADVGNNIESGRRNAKVSPDSTYVRIVDVGDLHTFGSFEEIDGSGLELDSTVVRIDRRILRSRLMELVERK
jgi:hypothetical protein